MEEEPTFAAPKEKVVFLENKATGHCIYSNEQGEVSAVTYDGSDHQKWKEWNGFYMNLATKKCLATDNKGNVFAAKPNGKNNQKWRFNGTKLVNEETNKILDVNWQGEVYAHDSGYGDSQTSWVTYWAT
jgi:hypothetical protein